MSDAKIDSFRTHGIGRSTADSYLSSAEGQIYFKRVSEADPMLSLEKRYERAIQHLTSGRELPRMEIINEPLVKIVPHGTTSSSLHHSPFLAKEVDLDAASRAGKNLGQYFGLPDVSQSNKYDVYRVTPKAPTEVFVNTVAQTSELVNGKKINTTGGATQYLTPNRQLFDEAKFVKSIDNLPHIALRGSTAIKAAGILGTAYGVYQGIGEVKDAMDMAKSTKDQYIKGAQQSADVGTRGIVTGVAATAAAVPGAAAGTFVAPGVGTVIGGLAAGAAGAVAADKVYEKSWLQDNVRKAGAALGDFGYNHISKEGRLLGTVNDIKADLQQPHTPAERQALQHKLEPVQSAYNKEAHHNQQYYEGKQIILDTWDMKKIFNPKLDKDTVLDAYDKRFEQGQNPNQAAAGAYEDGLKKAYPPETPQTPAYANPLGDMSSLNKANDSQDILSKPLSVHASSKEMIDYAFAAFLSHDDNLAYKAFDQVANTDVFKQGMKHSESVVQAFESHQQLQAQNQAQEIKSPSISMRM
jgi:hypothetical protein